MKILNLYAGIGGNRKLWTGHEVTAVECDPIIAAVYKDLYPEDKVIIDDAHEYLRLHHKEYEFIWASPPCQTHSSFRYNISERYRGSEPKYPDMKLYEEIIYLQTRAKALWVVENVVPYYKPLITAHKIDRHLYWSNFELPKLPKKVENLRKAQIAHLEQLHGYDLSKYKLPNKRQILRNCVPPETGLAILKAAQATIQT